MKHKPMLFNKLSTPGKGIRREVIGLIGIRHGVGVTHTGLMLAFHMGEELGKRTAYLECNNHQDMSLIQGAYEWTSEEDDSFSFHLITCYKEKSKLSIPEIINEDFESIILDFGTDFITNREEFLRCDHKIILGGSSEWDYKKLMDFTEAVKTIRGSASWLYFIPQASDNRVKRIQNEVTGKVYAVPYKEEPTMPSRETRQFFNRVF